MDFVKRHGKRVLVDAAGYALILASILTGWLPGPGGIPLLIAGLGLLSINNTWAKRLRMLVVEHGGKIVKILFPRWPWLEWAYDIVALLLLTVTFLLALRHAHIWELGIATTAFFIALFIALTNRDRLNRLKQRRPKHKH